MGHIGYIFCQEVRKIINFWLNIIYSDRLVESHIKPRGDTHPVQTIQSLSFLLFTANSLLAKLWHSRNECLIHKA